MAADQQFVELVKRMRDAQRRYFRDRNNLEECKRIEREVDRAIESMVRPDPGDLFPRPDAGSATFRSR